MKVHSLKNLMICRESSLELIWKWVLLGVLSLLPALLVLNTDSLAQSAISDQEQFSEDLKIEISKSYPGAEIATGLIQWIRGPALGQFIKVESVTLLGDDGRGNIHFLLNTPTSEANSDSPVGQSASQRLARTLEGWVGFTAKIPAKVAQRRIYPGERLNSSAFAIQKIDVSRGSAREMRGIILGADTEVGSYESTQTILEGQFVVSAAVRRIPDVRRGDPVRIQLVSGDLVLSTAGVAQEPAYLNGPVRALTSKNKREVSGLLKPEGVVEVKL